MLEHYILHIMTYQVKSLTLVSAVALAWRVGHKMDQLLGTEGGTLYSKTYFTEHFHRTSYLKSMLIFLLPDKQSIHFCGQTKKRRNS